MTHAVQDAVTNVVAAFAREPGVRAVVLGGSQAAGAADPESDVDIYVYCDHAPDLVVRRELLEARAIGPYELDNRRFEGGDEWLDLSGLHVDVMYRSADWIEGKVDDSLVRHRPELGYTTCLLFNVVHSEPLLDRSGWFAGLRRIASANYPSALSEAIIGHNLPMVRGAKSSFLAQLRAAGRRGDEVASNHRLSAFLASWFDVFFAHHHALHPGEKRLMEYAWPLMEENQERLKTLVASLLRAGASERGALADAMADELFRLLDTRWRPATV